MAAFFTQSGWTPGPHRKFILKSILKNHILGHTPVSLGSIIGTHYWKPLFEPITPLSPSIVPCVPPCRAPPLEQGSVALGPAATRASVAMDARSGAGQPVVSRRERHLRRCQTQHSGAGEPAGDAATEDLEMERGGKVAAGGSTHSGASQPAGDLSLIHI